MKKTIKLGIIGLGDRGCSLIGSILKIDGIEIVMICDVREETQTDANKLFAEAGVKIPVFTTDWQDVVLSREMDTVIVATGWSTHISMAVACMNNSKAVAFEVGGAYSIDECRELIKVYQRTKVPCMMLENCCYDKRELMLYNMAKDNLFGTIVHLEGSYGHDLRQLLCNGESYRHYRLYEYINRNCDTYPTHELGPLAKLIDINRGNRMVSLVSMASKSAGMSDYIQRKFAGNKFLVNARFNQGDIVTTLIKCANGETIELKLDTTLPRCYGRNLIVRGTKGFYREETESVFIDGVDDEWHFSGNNMSGFEDKYLPKTFKDKCGNEEKGAHLGADYMALLQFFHCVKTGAKIPVDVYDAAAWMSITCLSEQSIALGGAAVAIPDFTNGQWQHRRPMPLISGDL